MQLVQGFLDMFVFSVCLRVGLPSRCLDGRCWLRVLARAVMMVDEWVEGLGLECLLGL